VVEANRRETSALPDATAHAPRAAVVPLVEGAVIVEPRQAELLAQLARQLQGTRQAVPGVSFPRIEAVPADAPPPPIRAARERDTVLEHRDHWEKVGDKWPFVHRSL